MYLPLGAIGRINSRDTGLSTQQIINVNYSFYVITGSIFILLLERYYGIGGQSEDWESGGKVLLPLTGSVIWGIT